MKFDLYEDITNRVIEQLENGVVPWQKPWHGASGGAYNVVSKKPFSILNQLLLKHPGDGYITLRQLDEMGGRLKPGSHPEKVIFWKMVPKKKKDSDDNESNEEEKDSCYPVIRYYREFWIGDTTLELDEKPGDDVPEPVEFAENVIREYVHSSGVKFTNDMPTDKAYYSPMLDSVVIPMISQYDNSNEYYSTAFHELVHSTGKQGRLNRISEGNVAAFGSEDYSFEELVAEIGSAACVNKCGLETNGTFNNSASYIKSWLSVLKNDKKMIVSAASKSSAAVKMIFGEE